KIETGDRRITLDEAFWFAYALGVSPQALMLPRRSGSRVAVTPTRSLETVQALDWLRGYYFAADPDQGADEPFFFEERIEHDAIAFLRYPELSVLRNEAAFAVRFAMDGNTSSLRYLLDWIQNLAKDALRRLDHEEQAARASEKRRAAK